MKIFELFGSIFVESDKANESLDKTDGKAKNIAASLGKGIKTAAKWTAGITVGAVAVGGAMLKAGEKFAETTDHIDKMSQKLGMTRKGFQEWDFILSQNGASIDGMKSGMVKLNNSFDELKSGSGAGADAFKRLGLTMDDLAGKSQEEIFELTVKSLQGVSDESERAAIANDLLGKSALELTPLLNAGADSIDAMKEQANEMGMVIGDDAIDAGVKFADTMDQLKRTVKGLAIGFMSTLMPMLQDFLVFVQSNMPLVQGIFGDVFKLLGASVESVIPIFKSILEGVLPPLIALFSELGSNIIPLLVSVISSLIEGVLPVFIEIFNMIINTLLPPFLDILNILIKTILPPFIELFITLIQKVLPPLIGAFKTIIDIIMPPLIELFSEIIENVMPIIIELFNVLIETVLPPFIELIQVIIENVLPFLIALFMEFAEHVLPYVMKAFESMKGIIQNVMNVISSIIKAVLALIRGDWDGAWQGIKDAFGSILDAIIIAVEAFIAPFEALFSKIAEVVSGIWNGLVENIKGGINWIISGINSFIEGVNGIKIPDWVPGVGGNSFSINTIPMLEQGGDILKSGRVIVGEKGLEEIFLPEGAKVKPLKQTKLSGDENSKGDVYQTVNVYSPKHLSPSEVGKETKKASRKLAREFA